MPKLPGGVITSVFFLSAIFLANEGAIAARAEIKTFKTPAPLYQAPRKGLYGLGVAAENDAAIVIINGNMHTVSISNDKKIQIDDSIKTVAASLTYVNVGVWSDIPVTAAMKTREDLHALLNTTLEKFGYKLPGSFPFLLKGVFSKIDSKLSHLGQQREFSDRKVAGTIVGIFTRKASASDSEFESSSQMHFISDNRKHAGIVETVTIDPIGKVSLFLAR